MTLILAVDPGFTGALAWLEKTLDGGVHLLAVTDMPTASAKQGATLKNHIQAGVLAQLVRQNPLLSRAPDAVVIEEVHAMPKQGVSSTFRFGYGAGLIEGAAAGIGLPVHFMRTNEWQPIAQVRRGDDAGRLRAVQLFPNHALSFSRKMDHGRADAALIGYAFLKSR